MVSIAGVSLAMPAELTSSCQRSELRLAAADCARDRVLVGNVDALEAHPLIGLAERLASLVKVLLGKVDDHRAPPFRHECPDDGKPDS